MIPEADKKLMQLLLDSDGRITTNELSQQFRTSTRSISSARKRLEEDYISRQYSLDPTKFGWRRIDLLIHTNSGKTMYVGKVLFKLEHVIYVARMIGEHTIDLHARVIVKDYKDLLDLIESIKAIDAVRDVIWSEVVQTIGTRNLSNLMTL
ncbi:MAG: hypothetical protein ACYCQJ_00315 [Nitrososphaerales archaeon]